MSVIRSLSEVGEQASRTMSPPTDFSTNARNTLSPIRKRTGQGHVARRSQINSGGSLVCAPASSPVLSEPRNAFISKPTMPRSCRFRRKHWNCRPGRRCKQANKRFFQGILRATKTPSGSFEIPGGVRLRRQALTPCRSRRRSCRRARSSWYGRTARAVDPRVHTCARRNSRAAPGAGWRAGFHSGSRHNNTGRS